MRDRSYRLGQENRIKKRVSKYYVYANYLDANIDSCKNLGKLAHAKVPCSCPLCGNPRKYSKGKDKLTYQERKHEQK